MGAPGLTSPIRRKAFENMQLNAGVFLVNFDHSKITNTSALKEAIRSAIDDETKILGVTRGGGSFTVTRETRTPEVDGLRYGFKGSDFVDSVDANLSGTLLEATTNNFKVLLGTGEVKKENQKTIIKVRTAVKDDDYIPKLCWVGDLSDGRLIMIELDNAFNTADFSLTFTDKGEGTMTFEFHARQEDVLDYDYAPFRIIYFDSDGSADSSEDDGE